MNLSLNPSHLKRYKDIARLVMKYGGTDVRQAAQMEEALVDDEMEAAELGDKPEKLARDLEELGPTFIKMGQLLSTRPDLLPPPYLDALSRLQDDVEPFSYEEVERAVTKELDVRLSRGFQTFEHRPQAAASLAQVHRATLREGREVVVKVQRPGVRPVILKDLETLDELAGFLDEHTESGKRYAFSDMLDEFRKSLLQELDYRQEAQNLVTLGDNLSGYDALVVPQPVWDYTTTRVLTMDYVAGTPVKELSPVARTELDGGSLAEALCKAYLDQVLVDGFFHADPHPGNVFVTDDHRLALLDLGMVARIEPRMQEELLKLLLAISDGQGRKVADLSRDMGTLLDDYDEARFRREVADLVGRYQNTTVEDMQVGRIVMEVARVSGQRGVRPAPELTMLGKTLSNIDEIARLLAPQLAPNAVVQEHAQAIMQRRMLKNLSPGNVFSTALELNEFTQRLPGRLNAIMDTLAEGDVELHVQMNDEAHFLSHLHKVSSRISMSLVFSALIVGAALLMRVDTTFTIWGYPGIAMIFFLLAVACGFALVVDIVREK